MNVILIGARASGKSTIGPMLARAAGWPFVELDDRALRATGFGSIREVWETRGEQAWRNAETSELRSVLARHSQVVALGGGAPAVTPIEAAVQAERACGRAMVVYLQCPVGSLQARLLANPGDRPSLTGAGVVDEVATIVASREPIYQRMADVTCDTSRQSPPTIVQHLLEILRTRLHEATD